jgi:hypothetical protein
MAFSLSYRRLVEAVLAVVATAAMFYFGNGLEPWWPLMWFAPLPPQTRSSMIRLLIRVSIPSGYFGSGSVKLTHHR